MEDTTLASSEDIRQISNQILELMKMELKENNGEELQQIYQKFLNQAYHIGLVLNTALNERISEILQNNKKIIKLNNNNLNTKQIVLLTSQFIFALRALTTNENLIFSVAGTMPKGNELVQKEYKQEVIFGEEIGKYLSVSNDGTIKLKRELESLVNLATNTKTTKLSDLWSKIIEWGYSRDYINGVTKSGDKYYKTSNPKSQPHPLYQQQKIDNYVYYYFSGNRTTYLYSDRFLTNSQIYSKATPNLVMYDRGWLYQWGKILEQQEMLEAVKSNKEHPLYPLVFGAGGRENLPGIRGGDFGLYQFKHQNRQIITLNNIWKILNGGDGYNGILNSLNIARTLSVQQGLDKIAEDFTFLNKENVEESVKEEIEDLGKDLEENLLIDIQK